MSAVSNIVVLVMDMPGTYIVGESAQAMDTRTLPDKICLRDAVQLKVVPNPETGGDSQQIFFNPIMVCESLFVDLGHYIGAGELKEPFREAYLNWRKAYHAHEESFPTEETETP